MVCPYCSCEMEKGTISGDGRRGATWRADSELSNSKKVTVAKWNLSSFKIEAFYCDSCKKMLIDVAK